MNASGFSLPFLYILNGLSAFHISDAPSKAEVLSADEWESLKLSSSIILYGEKKCLSVESVDLSIAREIRSAPDVGII